MLVANTSIDTASLAALVAREYGATADPVFVPGAGGDSWCYRAGDWWVSVRRDRLGHVAAAYEAARELRDHGFEFVLAPARGHVGGVVHDVDGRPAVVFPYVQGTSLHPGPVSRADAAAIGGMVDRLHAGSVAAELPVETFGLFVDDELTEGIRAARRGASDAGPYASSVSALVRANEQRLDAWRQEMASVIATCRSNPGEFVLTHGEPDGGNVMAAAGDGLLLMDWGALQWAPPERDDRALRELGLPRAARPAVLRYYELQWILSEVAEYVSRFVHPHAGDAEDEEKWAELLKYLART
jgi:hypothetical protein